MNQIELDFERAIGRHLLFTTRLRSILYGASIDEGAVVKAGLCPLGQWIVKRQHEFGGFAQFQRLHQIHDHIHEVASRLVSFYRSGLAEEARNGLVEIEQIGRELLDELGALKDEVLGSGVEPNLTDDLEELRVNYAELLELNGMQHELYQRIQEQTEISRRADQRARQNEEKFLNVMEQAPVGIVILRGKEMTIELANNNYMEMIGKPNTPLVGQSLYEVIPDSRTTAGPSLERVWLTGEEFHGHELRVNLVKDGREEACYFNYIAKPYQELEVREVPAIIVVVTDVTTQVLSKQALERSELQFRNLVNQSPFAKAILTGRDMVVTLANEAMLTKLWRRSFAEVEGKKLVDIFPELKGQKFIEILRQVYDSGEIYQDHEATARIVGHDGERLFYLDFQYAPLFNPDGTVSAVMVSANDITEKVQFRNGIAEAAERLSLATDGTKLATWDLNLVNYDIIYSSRLPVIFGYPPDAQLSHAALRRHVYPEDLRNIVLPSFEKALETGIYQYEARTVHPDGSLHWVRTQGKIIFDEHDKPLRMLGTMMDITEEKESQIALINSEGKFRTLANAMPQFIWIADKEGQLNYWNQAVFDFSGMSMETMQAGGWLSIVHPDDRTENLIKWLDAVRTGNDFIFEHRFRRHDGSYRWQLSRAIAQKDAEGAIQMWVGTSTDIHDRRIFMEELESEVAERTRELTISNDELTRTNMELAQFAYVASHDLQEPLRKIQTFASRILETEFENLSEKGKDYFGRMQASSTRMQQLISDLIAFSGTNAMEKHFEMIALDQVMMKVKDQLAENISRKKASIRCVELPVLEVIPYQMEQLFTNLIGNALKFTRENTPPVIHITCSQVLGDQVQYANLQGDKTYYCIQVRDNGIGFDHEYKDRIFQVFQRLHSKSAFEGTGIGLAICKKIVENHAGAILAEGDLGEGAVFSIYLPEKRFL